MYDLFVHTYESYMYLHVFYVGWFDNKFVLIDELGQRALWLSRPNFIPKFWADSKRVRVQAALLIWILNCLNGRISPCYPKYEQGTKKELIADDNELIVPFWKV